MPTERETFDDSYYDDEEQNNPEAVIAESYNDEELPTPRSILDDINEFESVMKNPLSYAEQGLLVLKYRSSLASAFGTTNDPIRTEAILQSCATVSRLLFTRTTGLPTLINPVEGLFMLNDKDLKKRIKKTNQRLYHNEKKNIKKDKYENDKKDKKKKKDKKLSKKEKKKLKKKLKKQKKNKKDKKGKKKDKKGKKDKKKKKDKKGKKDKKDKKGKKDKKDKKYKGKKDELRKAKQNPLSISDQFTKFSLISEYLGRSDSSISRFVPCMKFIEAIGDNQTPEQQEETKNLRKAAEFQYRSEECWRSYLTQVRHCRYSNNPGACAASFISLEAECSLYGLEAHRATNKILEKE